MVLELELISPEKVYYKGSADKVNLPGMLGFFTVLPRHAALISVLVEGYITYTVNQTVSKLYIGAGLVEVKNNKVTVCIERLAEEYELYEEDEGTTTEEKKK